MGSRRLWFITPKSIFSNYSEIQILNPLLRKLNTGTENQIENLKYLKLRIVQSITNQNYEKKIIWINIKIESKC